MLCVTNKTNYVYLLYMYCTMYVCCMSACAGRTRVDIELVMSYIRGVAKESWLRRETLRSTRYICICTLICQLYALFQWL